MSFRSATTSFCWSCCTTQRLVSILRLSCYVLCIAMSTSSSVSGLTEVDVILLVLLHHPAPGSEPNGEVLEQSAAGVVTGAAPGALVVGFAWADIQLDQRDIMLDTRPYRRMCDIHFVFVAQEHRGRGRAGQTLYDAVERIATDQLCTHVELIADSTASEQLLRFYSQACGMSYMFTRLRKELVDPPVNMPPLPIPYAAAAAEHHGVSDMQLRLAASEELVAQLRKTITDMTEEREVAARSRSEAASVEQRLCEDISTLRRELLVAQERYAKVTVQLSETCTQFSRALKASVDPTSRPLPEKSSSAVIFDFRGVSKANGGKSPQTMASLKATVDSKYRNDGTAFGERSSARPGTNTAQRRLDELLQPTSPLAGDLTSLHGAPTPTNASSLLDDMGIHASPTTTTGGIVCRSAEQDS